MLYVLCLHLEQNLLYGAVCSLFYCTVSVCILTIHPMLCS